MDKNVDTDLKYDAFSRFSVKYFSKVLDSLSPHHKTIAKQVDVNCSDIVLGQKLIPLNKQSVHVVLGLPVGGSTIHSKFDSGKQKILQIFGKTSIPSVKFFGENTIHSKFDSGKQKILQIFGKTSIPSVKFFGEKIIKNEELPDDQILICFMIVSLNCFLCPNSSLIPSTKYLSAFEDMDLIESLDWCKLVFDWLMEHISKIEKSKTFGGCLFHLAVNYLDFLNFGSQKVLLDTPRIKVWKRSMIKDYSKFDKISEGVYGKRPVNDIASTCYPMLKKIMMMLIKLCKKNNNFTSSPKGNSKTVLDDDKLPIPNEEFNPIKHINIDEIMTKLNKTVYNLKFHSPDVVFIGEKKFSKKCANIGNKTNMMYNKMNRILLDSQKQNFKTFASPERVLLCNMKNFNPSTSGTKPIHHDLRRVINPAKYCTDPYTPQRSNFTVSQYERQIYNAVCTLSTSRYQEQHAVEIDDSPDVVFIGEKKFSKKCADIGNKTNMMYNKMNRILLDSQKQNFKTFASPERVLL
uniref:Ubiquitin-like protease family profile domain-containing protein n=1 Tax=Oryza rufipogon TaxID=4529 RepID=A0A0E0QL62_ORYRU